jgi:hypothetical protein
VKRFIEGEDRSQSALFPEHLDDYIAKDNPVRVIDVFVDELDLKELGFEGMEPEATGRPGYHPGSLLRIYIYGYLKFVAVECRKLADSTAPAENSLTLGVVLDSRQTIEVRILRPKRRAMSLRGCEHYAVCHRYPVQDRKSRGFYGRRPVEIDDAPLFHNGDGSQRVVLAALLANPLEHLKQ